MAKATLDEKRPFAKLSSMGENKAVYEQDGVFFGADKTEVGKADGFHLRQQREEQAEAKAQAEEANAAAARAAAVLGDLGADPNAEAQRENAAAAAAEGLSDDAQE